MQKRRSSNFVKNTQISIEHRAKNDGEFEKLIFQTSFLCHYSREEDVYIYGIALVVMMLN